MKVRLKDIAKAAGVSPTTVSLVLNNRPVRVSDNTRKNILKLSKELNYIPNQQARSLAKNQTNMIGLIVPNIENPFFASIATSIESLLTEYNYITIIMNSNDSHHSEKKMLEKMTALNVDGLIIVYSNEFFFTHSVDYIQKKKRAIPTILLDRYIEDVESPQVYYNNELSGYITTKFLISIGHQNIGMLGANETLINSRHRYKGYKKALKEHNIAINEDWYVETAITFEDGYNKADQILRHGEVTSVICGNDLSALGFMRRAEEIGCRIPDDISVVGHDNIELNRYSSKPLTSIEQNPRKLAEYAVNKLINQIEHKSTNHSFYSDIILEPNLVIGKTTKRL
ncbi:LacI family DNA-binding transcriptional regulator [Suicoccus acidiformans]|uniref:LacI family DNA-binding transcriptional regulator n=1 Tax=Suicoccus acidiformans TaxID=2036206 RepID=UPI0013C31E5E|nr:LacI family DNA-binding transcriptional regulator [Suicoccus acidiformans]